MKKKIINIEPLGFPWQTQDPFLFCAYHKDEYPQADGQLAPKASLHGRNLGSDFTIKDGWRMYHGRTIPGFPYHPHRGFETITITKQGMVDHADSQGASGRYGNGDVQWMTAGRGLQHSEMFPLLNDDKDNTLEIFQVWLNLPKKDKLVDPYFKMLWSEDIPIVDIPDENNRNVKVKVIVGNLNGCRNNSPAPNSWARNEDNEVAIWTIEMDAHAKWKFEKSKNEVTRSLFFYKGNNINIGNASIPWDHLVELDANQDIEIINGDQKSYMLMLQARPIKEPIAKYGPFVMNTQEEIKETIKEFRRTEFGGWPWDRPDKVHPKTQGRFAKYKDGKEEIK